jgi:hypothetical protein
LGGNRKQDASAKRTIVSRFIDDHDDDQGEREPAPSSGRVTFDDRGNAVWDTGRRKGVRVNPSLTLVDEQDSPLGEARNNSTGARKGYNPYESGLLASNKKKKEEPRKRKDLAALSKWIQLKKNMGDKDKP